MTGRVRGLVVLAGAAACAGLNVATLVRWHEYRVFLFPFALAMVPVGLTLVVTGATPEDLRAGRVSRWVTRLMLVGLVAGAALGFVVNHLVAG